MADQEVVALVARARDEASAALAKIHKSIGDLAHQADVGGRALGGLHSVLQGVAQGIGISLFFDLQNVVSRLIQSIPDLVSRGMQWGQTVDDISDRTGATAEESSKLAFAFQFLGINTAGLGATLNRLSANARQNEGDFRAIGIQTRDTNGGWLTSTQILDNLRRRMQGANMDAGQQAALTKILGRGWGEFADYLNLTDQQMALVNEEAAKLGLVLDEKARVAAENAGREMNLLQLSLTGLASEIFQNVAPALIGFVDTLANWVRENSSNIANFVSTAAAYIFGLINALTGSSLTLKSFTETLGSVGGAATKAGEGISDYGGATDKAGGATDKASGAVREHIRALDDEGRALDKTKKAISSQIDEIERKRRVQEDASNAAKRGIQDELNAQLSLLDAVARERRQRENDAQLNQELLDAERAQKIAEAGTNGVVDPDAVHAAILRVNDIKQQMADNAFDQGQDQQRQELTADANAKTEKISNAQATADAQAKAATDALTAKLAAIDKEKEALDAVKQKLQDQLAALGQLKTQGPAGPKAVGAAFAEANLTVEAMTSGIAGSGAGGGATGTSGNQTGTRGSLIQAMDDARLAGQKMGDDIKAAIGGALDALGKTVDIITTLAGIIGGLDKGELGLGLLALAVATGNPLLAAAGLALMGSAVSDATRTGKGYTGPTTTNPGGDINTNNRANDTGGKYYTGPGFGESYQKSAGAGTTIEIPIYLNGREIARQIVGDISELQAREFSLFNAPSG